jgi:2-amino-4-hydroxy-6-hydroxymethyldihydropteridine diphosphokinase
MEQSTKTVYILLGNNLGDRFHYIQQAINEIEKTCGNIILSSSVYETEAWGVSSNPPYLNQVIAIQTFFDPESLMQT